MIWAQFGMELCLASLALGLAWISIAGGGWPSPPLVFAPAAVGLAAARLFPGAWRRLWWYDPLRWTVALGWAAGCAVFAQGWAGASVVAGWNVAFMAGLLLFWRGWSLGDDGVEPRDVQGTVGMALVAAVALVAVAQALAPGAGLLPGIGTLLFGLLALGLARRAERRRPGAPPESDWLTLVAVLGVAILLVGGLLLLLVTPDALVALLGQVQALAGLLIASLGTLFGWLASLFAGGGGGARGTEGLGGAPAPSPVAAPPPSSGGAPAWNDWLWTLLTVILPVLTFVGLVVFVALPLIRRVSRLRHRRGEPASVEREPGPPTSSVDRFSWRAWWRALLARLLGGLGGAPSRPAAERRAAGSRAAAIGDEPRSIRELYRTVLNAASRQGLGRTAATTPFELRDRLAGARPGARRPLGVLTDLYSRTRYGEEPLDRGEVARMRSAVQEAVEQLKRRPAADDRS